MGPVIAIKRRPFSYIQKFPLKHRVDKSVLLNLENEVQIDSTSGSRKITYFPRIKMI